MRICTGQMAASLNLRDQYAGKSPAYMHAENYGYAASDIFHAGTRHRITSIPPTHHPMRRGGRFAVANITLTDGMFIGDDPQAPEKLGMAYTICSIMKVK